MNMGKLVMVKDSTPVDNGHWQMLNGVKMLLLLLLFIISLELLFSSVHTNIKKKGILVLGKDPGQGLDDTTIKPEAKYSY